MKVVFLILLEFLAWSSAQNGTEAHESKSESNLDQESSDCDNWPSRYEDLWKCCLVPGRESYFPTRDCGNSCTSADNELDYGCFMSCYIDETGLIKNGTFDSDAQIVIYANNYFFDRWEDVIASAIKNCEFKASDSETESLATHFNCLEVYMSVHCKQFHETDFCYQIQVRFETCEGIKPNCTFWPKNLLSADECCIKPMIAAFEIPECTSDCHQKEFFQFRQNECELNCTWMDAGLMTSEGAVDFNKIKHMLIEDSNRSNEWVMPIEYAVEKCQKTLKSNFSRTPNLFFNNFS